MIANGSRVRDTHATYVRAAGLFACTVVTVALLLVTSKYSEAQTSMDNSVLTEHASSAVSSNKADSADTLPGTNHGDAIPVTSRVLPLAVITDNFNLVPGQAYSLIYSDTAIGASSAAIVDFNGLGGTISVINAWIDCGYSPHIVSNQEWLDWCPEHGNVNNAEGPTEYWLGSKYPVDGPYWEPSLIAGEGYAGWWLHAAPFTSTSRSCPWIATLASARPHEFIIPMADIVTGGGNFLQIHLRALYTFRIQNSNAVCNPPPGESRHWYLEGVFLPDIYATVPALIDH